MYQMAAQLRAGRSSFFVSSKPGPRVRRSKAWEKGMGELFSLDAIEKETMLTYLVGRARAARKQPSAATAAHVHERAGGVPNVPLSVLRARWPSRPDRGRERRLPWKLRPRPGRSHAPRRGGTGMPLSPWDLSQHCHRDPAHPTRYPGLMSEGSACRATCKLGRFARADRHLRWPTVAPT